MTDKHTSDNLQDRLDDARKKLLLQADEIEWLKAINAELLAALEALLRYETEKDCVNLKAHAVIARARGEII